MAFSERLQEIRTGFERPFWVANISELFERLSYYAVFASLVRYLHENLQFPVERATGLASVFNTAVWFLAAVGGTMADRLGFRRALSLAYLILSCAYFLVGSITAPWMAPVRNVVPLTILSTFILLLPALGVALVKPSVVGTTARASKENVRSIGYSIYYTIVNIGGAAGPYLAGWIHERMRAEIVFRMAAVCVFVMFFFVLLLFREPKRSSDERPPTFGQAAQNFWTVVTNPKFMLFLLIFSGYWVMYWQEFITLPIYIHDYINANANTEKILATGPVVVIVLTMVVSVIMRKLPAFHAIVLGSLISSLGWVFLILQPTVKMAIATLVAIAVGELVLSPRYYEYISRLAPADQQGTYLGFAFLPIGIGSLIAGPVAGKLLHHYGEVTHQPVRVWWVITGIGLLTTLLLWVYDRAFLRNSDPERSEGEETLHSRVSQG